MKKTLFLLFAFSVFQMNAQTVNGFNLEDIPARYIEVVSTAKMLKPFQVTTYVDYGQIAKANEARKGHIIGPDGKQMTYNGTIGVLNALEKKGFRYLNQYLVTVGNQSVYHTILENTNYNKE